MMVSMWPSADDIVNSARTLTSRAGTAVALFLAFYILSRIPGAIIERITRHQTQKRGPFHTPGAYRPCRYAGVRGSHRWRAC
jgi:hypothetical protein